MGSSHLSPVRSSGGSNRQSLLFHLFDHLHSLDALANLLYAAEEHDVSMLIHSLEQSINTELEVTVRQLERALGGEIEVDYCSGKWGTINSVFVGGKEVAV